MHDSAFSRHGRPSQRGFTLVEVLVAVVIVGVLASIALPSFLGSIRKSRRAEAFTALAKVQQGQERWRSSNTAYTSSLSTLSVPALTPSGYYTLSLAASTVSGDTLNTAYVATAIGVNGTSQANDTACRRLSVRVRGGNIEYAGCGSCTEFVYAASNACWAQ